MNKDLATFIERVIVPALVDRWKVEHGSQNAKTPPPAKRKRGKKQL